MPDNYNKGEWSEFYVLAKVLADGKVDAADENLTSIKDTYYPVIGVNHKKGKEALLFRISSTEKVEVRDINGKHLYDVSRSAIRKKIKPFFDEILKGSKASFQSKAAEELKKLLGCKVIKAKSADKADVEIAIHDYVTSKENDVGFSIKSNIGAAPTLMNASQSTNFRYRVVKFRGDISRANSINTKNKIRDRVSFILAHGGRLLFTQTKNATFSKNIRKVDTLMPVILAEFVRLYYEGRATSVEDLTRLVALSPAVGGHGLDYEDVKFKIKHLLLHVALGMVPKKLWDGFIKADGGYIVVKNDGDLVCYHIYNISHFSEYLFKQTKLDTGSSPKHKFGQLIQEGSDLYLDLNLQIRFI